MAKDKRLLYDASWHHPQGIRKRKQIKMHFLSKNMSVKLTFNNQIRSNCNVLKAEVAHDSGKVNKASIGAEAVMLCKQGRLKEALNIMQGIRVDSSTYVSILMACIDKKAPVEGKLVQAHMRDMGFEPDVSVATKLVSLYAKYGSLVDARRVFDKMPERNAVSWTAMIAACAKRGYPAEALKLYQEMQRTSVVLDEYIFASVLPACVELETLRRVHGDIIRANAECNVFVGTGLVGMYAKCERIENARQVFDRMPKRNVVTWTVMIAGYAQTGNVEEAMRLFEKMPSRGLAVCNIMIGVYAQNGCIDQAVKVFEVMPERDVISWTTMIVGYGHNGQIDKALELFEKMPIKDVVSWSAMIAGYVQNGYFEEAIELSVQMQKTGVRPNAVTFAGILPAYANLAVLQQGKEVHEDIIRCGYHVDVFVGSGLVDMYAKCGSIADARRVFDTTHQRNVVLWNAMIVGYAMHGCGKEAIQLFEQMQPSGTKPDDVTFVGVLSACCHAGLVEDGWQYFDSMTQDYHIVPQLEHYGCMVDLLGRAGRLDDAQDFISKMPIKPDATVWGSMLAACRLHNNTKVGELAAEQLFRLDSIKSVNYVLMSNIYAAAGRWDGKEKIRKMMKDRNLKKTPGRSWIEINNKVYNFLVGDTSHPQTEEIYAILERLAGQMKEEGYAPDTNFVLHDVGEEQKAQALHCHSEKLAVAFGIINTPPMTPVRVVKNLRVCGDCHSVIKFISKVYEREIILRDTKRFHHFKDGQCSCRDYW